jgi:hypothetical protein
MFSDYAAAFGFCTAVFNECRQPVFTGKVRFRPIPKIKVIKAVE